MKIGNYTFSLKNFEYLASRSDETHCFGATLCVNGKPFADCGNSGQGGPTDVHIFSEYRELGKEVEEFLRTQPKAKIERYDLELDVDLEYIVDELVQKMLEERELKKLRNKTKNCLVFIDANDESVYFTIKWKHPLDVVLKSPNGPATIKRLIAEKVALGHKLFNENIPAELLP